MKIKKKDIIVFSSIILCAIILIAISYYQFDKRNLAYHVAYQVEDVKEKYDSRFEDVKEGLEIGQSFYSEYNNLAKIYINFYTETSPFENIKTGGSALIGLKDEKGNIVKEDIIHSNHVRINYNYEFKFPVQKDSKNKNYYLYIKYLDLEDKCNKYFAVQYSKEDVYEKGSMYVNNIQTEGDLYFSEMYFQKNIVNSLYCITAMLVIILGFCIYEIYYCKNINPEKLFLYIVPMLIVIFTIATPIFKTNDEMYHWYRIYDMAQGNIFTKMTDGEPKSLFPIETIKIRIHDNPIDIRYADYEKQFNYEINDDSKKAYINLARTAVYNPIQYMFQALGAHLADIFTNKPIIMAYSARALNMIATAVILFLALKCIPYGKKILLIIMCLPIAIEGFTGMSPDAMTNAISFLFIAFVLKLANEKEKRITLKDEAILVGLSVIISLCKIVYLPIIGLLLILPKEKFKNRKEQILAIGSVMLVGIMANLIWLAISTTYLVTFKNGDSTFQLAYILTHPIQYIQMLFFTLNRCGTDYLYGLFGGEIGWDKYVSLFGLVPLVLGTLFAFFASTEKDIKDKFSLFQKSIIILIILAVLGLIFTSLFIQWTPVTYGIIIGVQGRYFIPILLLIALGILSNLKIENSYTEETKLKTLGITILLIYLFVFLNIVINNL